MWKGVQQDTDKEIAVGQKELKRLLVWLGEKTVSKTVHENKNGTKKSNIKSHIGGKKRGRSHNGECQGESMLTGAGQILGGGGYKQREHLLTGTKKRDFLRDG